MALLRIRTLLAAGLCLCTAACGAGLIAAVTGNNNNNPSPAPPSLLLTNSLIPLVPSTNPATLTRTVAVTNAQVEGVLRVEIRVPNHGAVQQSSPVILSGSGQGTSIAFVLNMQPIAAWFPNPTGDVAAFLAVVVDGSDVADPVPVTLLRPPVAELDGVTSLTLNPFGGTEAELAVSLLHATSAADLQMWVVTRDPASQDPEVTVTRPCTDLRLTTKNSQRVVKALVPGNTFAGPAALFVDDRIAGRSNQVGHPVDLANPPVVYRPDIAVALPAQGPTTGGSLVTLIGAALAPLRFDTDPPEPDFDRVEIAFEKPEGARRRVVTLAREELRTSESSLDRLVFTMPPSPDGRPGKVDLVLRVLRSPSGGAANVMAQVVANLFLFANPQPLFGPRGAVLDRVPVAVTPIALESAPGGNDAPDFGVLYSEGGVGYLQLLMAEENGMFIRFGPPRRIGDPEAAAERDPRDVVAGDFDGDQVPDLVLANGGAAQAVFHVVQGQPAPDPPLGPASRFAAEPATARCRVADFDEDGLPDILLLPGSGAPPGMLPRVMLARPTAGSPGFVVGAQVPVRPVPYEAVDVADIDGDQHLDVVAATGGDLPRFDVAYGTGTGDFSGTSQRGFQVPGYLPHAQSPAVGVHVVGPGPLRSIAVVLAGRSPPTGKAPPHPDTPPVVAVMHQDSLREFVEPASTDVVIGPVDQLGLSLVANLDVDPAGVEEMVVAVRGDAALQPLLLLQYDVTGFRELGAQSGSEGMLNVSALHFGTAFPAGGGGQGARAVFVVHESDADGFRERRLSTMLVFRPPQGSGLVLLAPDAGGPLDPVYGLVAGKFSSTSAAPRATGAVLDLAVSVVEPGNDRKVRILDNGGFGGDPTLGVTMWERENRLVLPTLALVPQPDGVVDVVTLFTDRGEIALWRPDESGGDNQLPLLSPFTQDLRVWLPDPALRTNPVHGSSQLQAADVDGDGTTDLVALLKVGESQLEEGDALLLLLRGKPAPVPMGEFPFELPGSSAAATPVHGNASSFALGDLVPEPSGTRRRLELALTVPEGDQGNPINGDHVRFYRHVSGATAAGDRWERSFDPGPGAAQVLLAGNNPTRVAAADFDRNGTVDLLVAAAGDSSLRLFLNSGQPARDPVEVAIEAFHESFRSPSPATPGRPTFLRLGDINGDGNLDVLLATESSPSSTAVAFYLSTGAGELTGPSFVPRTRVGDITARLSVDLADYNGDGVPDLPLAWSAGGSGIRNVRVLFGGSR